MAREWKPTKYDSDGNPMEYGWVDNGPDPSEIVTFADGSKGTRLPVWGQDENGNPTYDPSGYKTAMGQSGGTPGTHQIFRQTIAKDDPSSAFGNFASNLAQMGGAAAGMYGAVSGLGNLFGNGLASLSGSASTPSVTSSVTNGVPFTPEQQVGGWSTSATGDNMGEWDWLDNALQGDNNGIDFTPGAMGGDTGSGWDFPVNNTMGGTTIPASSIGADFGDVPVASGSTAPSGTFGGNVYGDPLTIVRQIANGTLPLSSLFNADGTSNATNFTSNGINYGNVLASLFGYMGNQEMADSLLEASRNAADRADPFAAQRPYYQSALKNMYDNPSQMMNNSLFSGIRDQAMNATQRALSAKGYGGSGNEALGMMQAGTQAQTQFAMPYLQQLATNAGAGFGPGQAGSIYQQGAGGAAQAQNNAYGNIGYGINQAIGNRSPLEDLFGRITSNGGQGNTGGNGSGINIRIA